MNKAMHHDLKLAVAVVFLISSMLPVQAQTFKVLYQFNGSPDGAFPRGALVHGSGPILYGATSSGGSSGTGTVFEFDLQTQKETVLYSFGGSPDGAYPVGGLIRDDQGNLYGATNGGGAADLGTLFKFDTSSGMETVLHSFTGGSLDGSSPLGGLILDSSGNLYGTSYDGGGTGCGGNGCGTVFELNVQSGETVLYSFAGEPNGANPNGNLLRKADGSLYGTTQYGGTWGMGTVFRLSPNGRESVLYNFGPPSDGEEPITGLIKDGKGGFYGMTASGGASNSGIIFELNADLETILHSFAGPPEDGAYPIGDLLRDPSGNLYGVTSAGGANGGGTVFELDTASTETVLHSFYGPDGMNPDGSLVRLTNGILFGTASGGGNAGHGVIFEVIP